MNENRLKILQMLSAGQITADEAERLIAALEKEPPVSPPPIGFDTNPKAKPKYLRVVVEPEKEGLDLYRSLCRRGFPRISHCGAPREAVGGSHRDHRDRGCHIRL